MMYPCCMTSVDDEDQFSPGALVASVAFEIRAAQMGGFPKLGGTLFGSV